MGIFEGMISLAVQISRAECQGAENREIASICNHCREFRLGGTETEV